MTFPLPPFLLTTGNFSKFLVKEGKEKRREEREGIAD
jgi:hypothetical protein